MFTTLIDPQTLSSHLGQPAWVVLDARFDLADPGKGQALFHEGHIPGARYVHLDTVKGGVLEALRARQEELHLTTLQPVIDMILADWMEQRKKKK